MKLLNLQVFKVMAISFLTAYTVSAQEMYTINSAPFNMKDYDEFSPVYYKNGIVFCSNRAQNVFIARVDSLGRPLLDLYFVKKKENQKWASPSPFFKELNTKQHEGPFTISKDGKTIYLTRNEGNFNEIFKSTYNGSSWDPPKSFLYNDPNADVGHPCLSADGKKLFFVSNKRGGRGGFDIYVSNDVRGNWSPPKNLGPDVNSSADELYPFYHANGRLYFASNRANSLGGLDIYYTKEKNGKWIKPIHLPAPINTKYNDFAFISDSMDRHGFVSSDRNNRAKLTDIFEFTMNFPSISNCKEQEINDYTYILTEPSELNTDTTTFVYEWDFGDGKKIRGRSLKVEHTFPKTGDYLVQLNVIDSLTGLVYANQSSREYPIRDIEQPYITCPEVISARQDISFDANKSYLPEKQIVNYYWDFGDENLAVGKEVTHKYTEPGTYIVTLSITYTESGNTNLISVCSSHQITVKESSQ